MLLFLYLHAEEKFDPVALSLQKITEKDRQSLVYFFQYLFGKAPCGYTLFGEKPISFVTFNASLSTTSFFLDNGWDVWKKCQHLFASNNFVLKKEVNKEYTNIFLINKEATLETIYENIEFFKTSPDKILENLCNPEKSTYEILFQSQKVAGILLGFGKENGQAFQREEELSEILSAKLMPPFFAKEAFDSMNYFGKKLIQFCPKNKMRFSTANASLIVSEFNKITNERQTFELLGSDYLLEVFNSPTFVCWENNQTTALLKHSYSETRKKLRELYKNDAFLENILKQWIGTK